MMRNIILAPLFGQYMAGRLWMGLDLEIIEHRFYELGWRPRTLTFEKIVESLGEISEGSVIFYSAIYNVNYLQYIQNTIQFIQNVRPDIILIPPQQQLISLDNKGFQEYVKKMIGIASVKGKYYGDIDNLVHLSDDIKYPFVLKQNKGALSSGVHLIQNKSELLRIQKKLKKRNLKERLTKLLNKKNSLKKDLGYTFVYDLDTINTNGIKTLNYKELIKNGIIEDHP